MKWRKLYKESDEQELKDRIRNIITTFFDLDDDGNPTIPTENDVGQIDVCEFSSAVIDRIWRLVK